MQVHITPISYPLLMFNRKYDKVAINVTLKRLIFARLICTDFTAFSHIRENLFLPNLSYSNILKYKSTPSFFQNCLLAWSHVFNETVLLFSSLHR